MVDFVINEDLTLHQIYVKADTCKWVGRGNKTAGLKRLREMVKRAVVRHGRLVDAMDDESYLRIFAQYYIDQLPCKERD